MEEEVAAVEERVKKGIDKKHIKDLIYYSKTDKKVQKYTSDSIRYKSLKSFEKYISKTKTVCYSLVGKNNDLAGIALFRFKNIPQKRFLERISSEIFGITFAIRIYGEYRGKGLAFGFMSDVFDKFTKSKDYKKKKNNKFWIMVSKDNIPAIRTYERFGFVKMTKPDEKGKFLMICRKSF